MDLIHGRVSTYTYHGCRCDECRAAGTATRRKNRAAQADRSTPNYAHGSATGYDNWGCRCAACTEAKRQRSADYRARTRAVNR